MKKLKLGRDPHEEGSLRKILQHQIKVDYNPYSLYKFNFCTVIYIEINRAVLFFLTDYIRMYLKKMRTIKLFRQNKKESSNDINHWRLSHSTTKADRQRKLQVSVRTK